jgi:predicted small metal-binding protein
VSAATEEELMAKVSEHVRKVHNVRTTTDTIASFVRSKLKQR